MFLDGQLSQQNLPLGFSTSRRSAFSSLHSLSLTSLPKTWGAWRRWDGLVGFVNSSRSQGTVMRLSEGFVSTLPTREITSPGSPWTLPSQPCFMLQFHLSPIHFVKVTFLILALFLCSCLVSPEYCTSFLCALLWWCSWYVFTISPVCALIGPLLVRCPLFFFFPTSYRVQHIFDGSEIHATFSKSF